MPDQEPFVCVECGGKVLPLAKEGRTYGVAPGIDWPIPASIEIPTCAGCGDEYISERLDRQLDRAVRDLHLGPVLERIPEQWGRYGDIGPGWHEIVLQLDQKLRAIDPNYEVHQVKQKFGGLRYYTSLDTNPEAEKLIRDAEALSFKTCERCGQPGNARNIRSVAHTLCDRCENIQRRISY